MLHRRLAWVSLIAVVPFAACLNDQNGDPGRNFSTGTGSYPTDVSGYGGSNGGAAGDRTSGTAGTGTAAGTGGGAGTGTAGAAGTGTAGATEGTAGAAGASDGGTSDGATSEGGSNAGHAGGDAGGTRPAACVVGATATFALAWSLEDATGAVSTCDGVGGKTVDIDVINAATGAEALATIPCGALAATTCAMPAGTYSIAMLLKDSAGNVISSVLAPLMFLVDGHETGVTSLPFQVGGDPTKGRGFAATWSIDKVSTGAIETCAQAGAASVRLTAGSTKFDLPCANGKGLTTALTPGSYPISLDLIDGTGASLSETQTMNVAIAAGQLVYIGDVPFDVN
jgi:hypothetical protein